MMMMMMKKDIRIQWAYTKTEGNKNCRENYSGKSSGGTLTGMKAGG